jgi:hypothetical protein
MLIKKNNEWELPTSKVTFKDSGQEHEKLVGEEDKQWWTEFESRWQHITDVAFEDVNYTEEQIKRFETVKTIDTNQEDLFNYVIDGVIEPSNKDLKLIALKEENEHRNSIDGRNVI